ncbi:linear gramicidin synthase subunit D [Clostridium puniceum]|uniref:Linear gramicidin synthase subunit D n=1 Tax=Clostridium puniceum TaxID=29367 RepID=A0A1S8T8E3_9CLOT|nr:non-ribosomal peptide synthetase [Clostridium puniceum]OOM73735.1 linear gramicidin synthase subunit D [Clostridium puniceum]
MKDKSDIKTVRYINEFKNQLEYWVRNLNIDLNRIEIPKNQVNNELVKMASIQLNFPNEIAEKILKISNYKDSTTLIVLSSILKCLLYKYAAQDIIHVITPLLENDKLEKYNKCVIIKSAMRSEMNFKQVLLNEKDTFSDAYKNGDYPLEFIMEEIGISKENITNIFNIGLVFENIQDINYVENYNFELLFIFNRKDNEISLRIDYDNSKFNKIFIQDIINRYIAISDKLISNIGIEMKNIEIVTLDEKQKLIHEFNNTNLGSPKEKTIYELFEEQVEKTPDDIAVIFSGEKLTYRELNERSNSLARVLREKDVKSESIVGIMLGRSLEMAVGIMGILKAGAAYLPIDPEYPEDRIKYMLEDSKSQMLLTQKKLIDVLSYSGQIIDIEDNSLYECEKSNLGKVSEPNNLSYIIYTSGTTGKPKGVMVEHRSVVDTLLWRKEEYQLDKKDNVLVLFSYAFDGFVTNFFTTILSGASAVIINAEECRDALAIRKAIIKNNITHFICIPVLYSAILECSKCEDLRSLRVVTLAGDKTTKNIIDLSRSKNEQIELVNEYGPTENSVATTIYRNMQKIDSEIIPIGKPRRGTKVYILDKNNCLVPIGVPGELCVSGDGLARGYLNREELTAEKFIDNPFESGTRMYKTGDIVKWLPDGNIEYIRRIDNQIKIRGFRIELGEIENQLLKLESINGAVVVHKTNKNQTSNLYAYVTAKEEIAVTLLKDQLAKKLPSYMIPSYIIQINKLPLTPNGKIDIETLFKKEIAQAVKEKCEAPRNQVEENILNVWKDVLGIDGIGISHNYYELGGDSIKSIQIVSRLQKYNINLKVKDIMEYTTIKQLSKHVTYRNNDIDQKIVEGKVELASIQKWFFENKFLVENHWNQAFVFYKEDGIQEQILKKSFIKILEHHDVLRMIFKKQIKEIIQENRGVDGLENLFTLNSYDLKFDKNYKNTIEMLSNELQKDIDFENGILIKLGLFKTDEGDFLLVIIHHLIIDGVSWRILLEDLENAYKAIEKEEIVVFPRKTTSYKEWTQKVKEYSNSRELLKEKDYWKEVEGTEVKKLPKDFPKSNITLAKSRNIDLNLTKEQTQSLIRKASAAYNTQINDILLCSLGLAIKEWCGNEKILISLEGHGREEIIKDISTERTMGWFTTNYPVILNMSHSDNISDSIKNTKETLRHIPNKGIGYGILTQLTEDKNKEDICFKLNPEISFNYLGEFSEKKSDNLFQYSELIGGMSISLQNKKLCSIEINSLVIGGELQLTLNYSTEEYKHETVEELSKLYKKNLIKLIEHCERREKTEKTPYDYGDKELTIKDLNVILSNKKDIEKIHSLVPMQEGMLYNLILDKKSHAYFEQSVFTIQGPLRIDVLNQVLNKLIEKYEIFRTAFFYDNISKPKQVVLAKRELTIHYEDISSFSSSKRKEYIEKLKKRDRDKGFDLTEDCLIRVTLIRTDNDKYKLIYSFHHIIMDGWCMGIIIKDVITMYRALVNGEEIDVETSATSYGRYLEWFDKQDSSEALEYWKDYLEDYEHEVVIPKLNKKAEKFRNEEELVLIGENLTSRLKNIAEKNNITVNSVIQTAWGILLQKYNNTNDVVFGSVISGRPSEVEGIENMVGLFINTVPVRVKGEYELSFNKMAKKINRDFLEANTYSYCSLAEIQSFTKLKNKLINHVVVYENYPIDQESINADASEKPEIDIVDFEAFEQTNYDFALLVGLQNELSIKILYNGNIYSTEAVKTIGNNLFNILNCIGNNSDIKLSEIEIVGKKEKDKLLIDFNNTELKYPDLKTIDEIFEEYVEKMPNDTAIIFEGNKLTYKELNERANSLARVLREKGVEAEKIVGIMVERSLEMIIGILGILKAGGAYLPIDPEYPEDRIKYMLEDSKANILLKQKKLLKNIEYTGEIIEIEDEYLYKKENGNLDKVNCSDTLAYVIYTSGTTGKPKGVMIEQKSLVNLILTQNKNYPVSKEDAYLMKTSFVFDVSLTEIFGWFGGKLIISKNGDEKDPVEIKYYMNKYNITHMNFVPTMLNIFLDTLDDEIIAPKLKYVFVAGEAITKKTASKFYEKVKNVLLINLYGPTEATIYCNEYIIFKNNLDKINSIPIGKPIYNYKSYILDNNMKLLSVNVVGELCIGGIGVSRGYLNKENLTHEKFVDNPFEPGKKIYRTGDLAKWLPNGNLEYLGRIDNQVKVRGFRIELGEIENQFLKLENVKEVVVVDKIDQNGDKYLCAYITSNMELDVISLKNEILKELPEYMVPSYIIQIDKMPVTHNGKVNRSALPENYEGVHAKTYIAPRNDIERIIVDVYKSIFKADCISTDDEFTLLGGNSIISIRLVYELKKKGINIDLKTVFSCQSAAKIADYIQYRNNKKIDVVDKFITKLKTGDSEKGSLILLPPAGGTTLGYMDMANKLSNIGDIYAIEDPRISKGLYNTFKKDEELINSYVRAISKVFKSGIDYVGGHSLGGALAFKVSLELIKQGKIPKGLVIMDSAPSDNSAEDINSNIDNEELKVSIIISTLGGNLQLDENELEELKRNGYDEVKKFIIERLKEINVGEGLDEIFLDSYVNVYIDNLRMFKESKLIEGTLPIPIIVFKADEQDSERNFHEWSKYTSKTFDVIEVPGNHGTILKNPNVEIMVNYIEQLFR